MCDLRTVLPDLNACAVSELPRVNATLSSVWGGYCSADRCIDGDHGGASHCNNPQNTMCASVSQPDAWLEIDLVRRAAV